VIVTDAIALGSDGTLYITGHTLPSGGGGGQVYLGEFNPSTDEVIGQGVFPDGEYANGVALAGFNNSLFLVVQSLTSSISTTDLFSGPFGSTTGLTKTPVPLIVAGDDQSPFGLLSLGGTLVVGLQDSGPSTAGAYLEPLIGAAFGTPLQIGDSNSQGYGLLPFGSGGLVTGTEAGGGSSQIFVAPFTNGG
jgi:hypothetical protein